MRDLAELFAEGLEEYKRLTHDVAPIIILTPSVVGMLAKAFIERCKDQNKARTIISVLLNDAVRQTASACGASSKKENNLDLN